MSNEIGFKVITGQRFNTVERCVSAVVASPAAASGYGVAYLSDRTAIPMKFSAATSPASLTQDQSLVVDGDMETAGLTGWTAVVTGTGAVARTTVAGEFNAGTAGMKLTTGTGTASAYQDVSARAGETLNVTVAFKGDGAANTILRIQNRQTGRWLKNDGTWQATSQDLWTRSAATWLPMTTFTFAVEGYATCLADIVTLRVTVANETSSKTSFVDDLYVWPSAGAMVVFGHTIESSVVVKWQHSDDGSSWSDVATMTTAHPAFYNATGSVKRWQRLLLTGAPTAAMYVGEWIICQPRTLLRAPEGMSYDWVDIQERQETKDGMVYSSPLGARPQRRVSGTFSYTTAAELAEARDEIFSRSRGGHWPAIVIPMAAEVDVLWGKIDVGFGVSREPTAGGSFWSGGQFQIVEIPCASFLP